MSNVSKILILVPGILLILLFIFYQQDLGVKEPSLIERKGDTIEITGILYRYPNCKHCEKVLRYFADHHVKVAEQNFNSGPESVKKFKDLGHPVLVVGDEVIIGPNNIISFIERNAEIADTKKETSTHR